MADKSLIKKSENELQYLIITLEYLSNLNYENNFKLVHDNSNRGIHADSINTVEQFLNKYK